MLNYYSMKYILSFKYDVNMVICYKMTMSPIQKLIIKHYNVYKSIKSFVDYFLTMINFKTMEIAWSN